MPWWGTPAGSPSRLPSSDVGSLDKDIARMGTVQTLRGDCWGGRYGGTLRTDIARLGTVQTLRGDCWGGGVYDHCSQALLVWEHSKVNAGVVYGGSLCTGIARMGTVQPNTKK